MEKAWTRAWEDDGWELGWAWTVGVGMGSWHRWTSNVTDKDSLLDQGTTKLL